MAADPPQVLSHTNAPTIILALTTSSTQIRLKNCTNLAPKHSHCIPNAVNPSSNYVVRVNAPDADTFTVTRNNKDDDLVVRNCIRDYLERSGNDNANTFVSPYFVNNHFFYGKCEDDVVGIDNDHQLIQATKIEDRNNPVVSPYFANSNAKERGSKRKRKIKPLLNDHSCGIKNYRLRIRGNGSRCYGKVKNEPHVNEERVVSQYFVKTNNKEKKRRKPQTDQPFETLGRQNDGYCYELHNIEQSLQDKSLPRGVSLDLQQKADCLQINKVKHANHKQKNLSGTVMSDVGNVKGDHKDEKKKWNRKEKIQDDQSYAENERVALNLTSSKAVSPYFFRKGACVCENSIIDCLKQTKKKVRKQRNSKKITCEGDEELETEVKIRLRKTKKKKNLIDQCCIEQHDKTKTLAWGSQSVASDGFRITVENDLVHETICQKDWINPGYHNCEDDKENKTGDVETKHDCANHREGGITNAKRKRVKSLHRLKIRKTDDDQAIHGDLGACDLMITSINREVEKKRKNKKQTTPPKCGTSADKEDKLVPLSIGSQKDLIHDHQDGSKTSAAKVVSPYFQKVSEKFECDVERDESNCKGQKRRRLNRTANIEFEELLSKYAYKCGSHINREVDIGGREEEEEDGSAGKSKRKGKKKRDKVRSLSAAEKHAEAYQRKAPDCTWRPPRSPYNLLQEDHSYDPWRVLVICILLNITTGPQVKRVLSLFFDVCPNAEAAVDADELRIASLIQSLGLHRKRAAMIQRFSREYLSDHWTHVTQLHGIGKYAADAYAMFCNGKWHQVTPNDHMLNYYWNFLQNRGLESLDFKEVAV